MATHSSILAWRIPGTGEPGGLPSMGSHRVGHDWSDLAAAAVWSRESQNLTLTYYSAISWNVTLIGLYDWSHSTKELCTLLCPCSLMRSYRYIPPHVSLHTVYNYGFICIIIWFIAVPQLDHKLHKDCEISPPAVIVVQHEWVSESYSVVSNSLGPHGLIQSMEFSRPEYWSG